MSSDAANFNLIEQPWIRARNDGGQIVELSIREVFHQANRLTTLANDIPTQDFAILRVLLAILQRSVLDELSEGEPSETWKSLWEEADLPIGVIDAYLDKWHDRFNLLDGQAPFMQVPDLEAVNGAIGELRKIIADVPDGDALFSLRSGRSIESLSYAESARWLVHVHAYDTSGIKTGVVGDQGVKGGKSYPIGVGWAGRLGGVYFEGYNLRETLLLNFVLTDDEYGGLALLDGDLPVWEQDPKRPGDDDRMPVGITDLYTWQSRRVRLYAKDERVVGVTLTNGDKLDSHEQLGLEPMTAWRRSPNLEKRLGISHVYSPATFRGGRALWRGLSSILSIWSENDESETRCPLVVGWIGYLASEDAGYPLPEDYPVRLRAIGFEYGTQNSVIVEAIDDRLDMSAYLLSPQGKSAAEIVKQCVADTNEAVRSLGYAARQLNVIGGADDVRANGASNEVMAEAFFELDGAFRYWLSRLGVESVLREEHAKWNRCACGILQSMIRNMVGESRPALIAGRKIKEGNRERWVTSANIEARFMAKLYKTLPYEDSSL